MPVPKTTTSFRKKKEPSSKALSDLKAELLALAETKHLEEEAEAKERGEKETVIIDMVENVSVDDEESVHSFLAGIKAAKSASSDDGKKKGGDGALTLVASASSMGDEDEDGFELLAANLPSIDEGEDDESDSKALLKEEILTLASKKSMESTVSKSSVKSSTASVALAVSSGKPSRTRSASKSPRFSRKSSKKSKKSVTSDDDDDECSVSSSVSMSSASLARSVLKSQAKIFGASAKSRSSRAHRTLSAKLEEVRRMEASAKEKREIKGAATKQKKEEENAVAKQKREKENATAKQKREEEKARKAKLKEEEKARKAELKEEEKARKAELKEEKEIEKEIKKEEIRAKIRAKKEREAEEEKIQAVLDLERALQRIEGAPRGQSLSYDGDDNGSYLDTKSIKSSLSLKKKKAASSRSRGASRDHYPESRDEYLNDPRDDLSIELKEEVNNIKGLLSQLKSQLDAPPPVQAPAPHVPTSAMIRTPSIKKVSFDGDDEDDDDGIDSSEERDAFDDYRHMADAVEPRVEGWLEWFMGTPERGCGSVCSDSQSQFSRDDEAEYVKRSPKGYGRKGGFGRSRKSMRS